MRNVTISLDDEAARWARIRAAELDTSVSRLLAQMIRERMRDDAEYDEAMERYLSIKPRKLRRGRTPLPRREELHERRVR